MVVTSNFQKHITLYREGYTILPLVYNSIYKDSEISLLLRPDPDWLYFIDLNHIMTKDDYVEFYTKYLNSIPDEKWDMVRDYLKSHKVAICSYERVGSFSPRHVLADYINTRFPGMHVKEYDYT